MATLARHFGRSERQVPKSIERWCFTMDFGAAQLTRLGLNGGRCEDDNLA
jgi:hypothetical protein